MTREIQATSCAPMPEDFGWRRAPVFWDSKKSSWKTSDGSLARSLSKAQGLNPVTVSSGETSVRRLAGEILLKVETRNAFADILLDQGIRTARPSERDRALLTELVYGTLRWRGSIDAQLNRHLRRPSTGTDPFISNLLRVALYQLLYLDKVPD